jgi:hypothetical protein
MDALSQALGEGPVERRQKKTNLHLRWLRTGERMGLVEELRREADER